MGRRAKYKRKYAKELEEGLRLEIYKTIGDAQLGWSIDRLCHRWGITKTTYYNWVKEYTSFQKAHEIGERDFTIFLENQFDAAIYDKNVNAGLMKMNMINRTNWHDGKQQEKKQEDKSITHVNINIIQPPKEKIEANIIDITDHDRTESFPSDTSS